MNKITAGDRGRWRRSGGGEEEGDDPNPETKTRDLKGIITSLLLIEDQGKRGREEEAAAEEKSELDLNSKKKTRSMLEFYSNLQDYYTDMDETDCEKRKKSRTASAAAAVAAADKAVEEIEKEKPSKGGAGSGHQQRRLWVKDRSKAWWDECSSPNFPEEEFRKAFRLGKSTFEMICEELNSVIAKEDTTLRNAIPVKQRVAVCIWRLATGEPLRLVSKRFGLGISTCHKLVLGAAISFDPPFRRNHTAIRSYPTITVLFFALSLPFFFFRLLFRRLQFMVVLIFPCLLYFSCSSSSLRSFLFLGGPTSHEISG